MTWTCGGSATFVSTDMVSLLICQDLWAVVAGSRRNGPAREGRHHLVREEAQRAQRLFVRERPPGEDAEDVVAAGRLQQARRLLAHAGRRSREDRLVLGRRLPTERGVAGVVVVVVPE